MSKYVALVNIIPIIYGTLLIIILLRLYQNEIIDFEQYVLNKQVNYASESATTELLESGHTSQDYANGAFQTYEPMLARNDFAATLAMNYNMVPMESTVQNILNTKVRTMAICVYDGFYIYYPQRTEDDAWELWQSPKIPYFYTDTSDVKQRQYCLTLDKTMGYWEENPGDGPTSGSNYTLHRFDKYSKQGPDIQPSDSQQNTAINSAVADAINWGLLQAYDDGSRMTNVINVPATGDRVRGEQPVCAPTIIAVVDGLKTVFSTSLTAESIGGAQVEESDHIVGYTLKNAVIAGQTFNGKCYAKSSWWNKHSSLISEGSTVVTDSGRYFDDEFDAAEHGYTNLSLLDW